MALTDAELVQWLLSVPVKVAELALPAMGIPLSAWQAYLQAHGWVCAGGFSFGSVWCQREGGPEIVLATPGGGLHTPRNHGQRLDALEQVEHRSQLAILAEIMGYLPTEVTANPEPSPPFDDDSALSAALVREPEKPKVLCRDCTFCWDGGLCYCPALCVRAACGHIVPRPIWATNPSGNCPHRQKREEPDREE
jgi:hypothetical protein